ncbi:MAG TPA: DUF2147 domain-containing protein [Gammaproteobacteria bacterium]
MIAPPMRYFFCLVFTLLSGVTAADDAKTEADRILGVWATEKAEAHVEISRDESGYRGRIVWLKEPFYAADDPDGMAGLAKMDRENPDPALRNRHIDGLLIMEGFHYAGDGQWTGGTIYDPDNGETYSCKLWLTEDGSLKVRGYVGISLFGRTTEWTPVLVRASPPITDEQNDS